MRRGLGSGFLWALETDRAGATAAVVACVAEDPRWDRQLDSRQWYYGELALRLGIAAERLTGELAIPVLGWMAANAHEAARATLRDHVAHGPEWDEALWSLTYVDDETGPRTGWEEAVAGLDEALAARFPTDAAFAAALEDVNARADTPPWSLWADQPRFARALGRTDARGLAADRPRPARPTPLGEQSTAELAASTNPRAVGVLAARTAPADVADILAGARRGQPTALRALGEQGRPELLELEAAATDGAGQAAYHRALVRLPFALTGPLAADWLRSPDAMRRRRASSILAAHAGGDEAPAVRAALRHETDQYVIGSLAEALGRAPEAGPSPELREAYATMPYSYGRHFVVEALAATDPAFDAELAVECAFDCEPVVRAFVSGRS
ncbi:hypothetical protein OJ997_32135 [Solirubrobacter phytolaccae]|uniref:HEAT repeat domain-containing protein n=1 Tax=Solirubrobacter phytolaccae TaxID=1404360 RepID=A0A9X3SBT4_9ACTN|nr:hypothetical protein [Solirubrobacter phytolaccae]MDA0184998.1 hypothetical protein [Solirubrobacter phytolaccae]